MAIVQLDQIAPGNIPGTGGDDPAIFTDFAPMAVDKMDSAGPAGVIDHHIEEYLGAERVDGGGQVDELVLDGFVAAKGAIGMIDAEIVGRGVRATVHPHAAVASGNGVYGQQMDDSHAQFVDNKGQFPGKTLEVSPRGQYIGALMF